MRNLWQNITQRFREHWRVIYKHLTLVIPGYLIIVLLFDKTFSSIPIHATIRDLIRSALSGVFGLFLFTGLMQYFLSVYRGHEPHLKLMLNQPGILLRVLIAQGALYLAVMFTVALTEILLRASDWRMAGVVFQIVFLTAILLLVLHTGFITPIFLDGHSNVIEAFRRSFDLTRSNYPRAIMGLVVTVGLILSGLLFFGIGIIITLPPGLLCYAGVYESLKLNPKTAATWCDRVPVHTANWSPRKIFSSLPIPRDNFRER